MKISIVVGIILAMPVLLYQLWAFIAPGLTPERAQDGPAVDPARAALLRDRRRSSPTSSCRIAIAFLFSFTDDVLRHQACRRPGPYFDFVTTLFLVFGLIMEFPIVLVGLSRVGIVTSERLRASRRMIILGIAIFAAVATPGGDLVSPIVLGGTMYILFELTVLFIRRTGR